MKLYEYQAKKIFTAHGIPIPEGRLATCPDDAQEIAKELGAVVLKPQLSVKGRGKVGGILFAKTPEEAKSAAEKLFSMTIKGEKVERLLVEKQISIAQELYLSLVVDYSAKKPVFIASSRGGVEIEEVAKNQPDQIFKEAFSLEGAIDSSAMERMGELLGLGAVEIFEKLHGIFCQYDAEMVEINPLIRTTDGDLVAVDAVLNINEDSLFRQPEILQLKEDVVDLNSPEERAKRENWTYIELDGNIGILSSGAGITMTILDLLNRDGGRPANFLDTAQMDREGIYKAFELLLENKNVQVVLVNIFAGLNRCDDLADGIAKFIKEKKPSQPLVVRMIGNREEEGHRILQEIGVEPIKGLESAVKETIGLAGGLS